MFAFVSIIYDYAVAGQVKNTASSDVRELLVVCSKAVNYAKSKSCQALADLEPDTSSDVDSTGKMLPWTTSTTEQIKHSLSLNQTRA